jgi:hypothetical protein
MWCYCRLGSDGGVVHAEVWWIDVAVLSSKVTFSVAASLVGVWRRQVDLEGKGMFS